MADQTNRWSETITMREAYLTMVEFIWNYYRVGGETEKEVEFMAGHISADPASFFDPALEEDWFEALAKVRK